MDNLAVSGHTATDALRESFEVALSRHPSELFSARYELGGRIVSVRVVGRRLAANICPALGHLEVRDECFAEPALTIDVWDEECTGVPCPPAARENNHATTWSVGEGLLMGSNDGRAVGYLRLQSVTWLDRQNYSIVGCASAADRLSLFERGKPFHFLLSFWHNDHDIQVVHAGFVGRHGGGVLIPGVGGAGKSTTCLACLRHGMEYLGDDYIGLEQREDGSFAGHSIFSSTWLEPAHYGERFPDLAAHAVAGQGRGEDKHLVLLNELYADRLRRVATIKALALPKQVDSESTSWRPARRAEALLTMAPSSMLALIPRPKAVGLQQLGNLAEQVPAYWLLLGRRMEGIGPALDEILHDATT